VKIDTSEGARVEVYGDLTSEGEEIAVLHLDCTLQFLGETIEIPGASFKVPRGTEVRIRGNTSLTRAEAVELAAGLLRETRPATEEEKAKARA
jgi:hypothetical protein